MPANPWKPPHKTARQRTRTPLDKAQLAPRVMAPVCCSGCGDPRLAHRDTGCIRAGCDCDCYQPPETTR